VTLTLIAEGLTELDNGMPARLMLDRHGALIGRAPTADWCLPDARNYVSSHHLEIDWRDGRYVLTDSSTNGTFLNGASERMDGPHVLAHGDRLTVGHYRLRVELDGAAASPPPAPARRGGWADEPAPESVDGRWDDTPPPVHARPDARSRRALLPPLDTPERDDRWDDIPLSPAESGAGAGSFNHTPPPAPPPTPPSSRWPAETMQHRWPGEDDASATPPADDDPWSVFLHAHEVVWPGDEAAAQPRPAPAPAARSVPPAPSSAPASAPSPHRPSPVAEAARWDEPPPEPERTPTRRAPRKPSPVETSTAAAPASAEFAWLALLDAAGLEPGDLKQDPAAAAATAGAILNRMATGLVRMIESRARAKAQLGALGTIWERDGNNPLKFSRDPDRALLQLLNPPERGFMRADRAIDSAFRDLQAHQMATLAAMQNALRSTLDRFSPSAIRARAERGGLMARILPGAREAALWKAYEREFDGVVRGSDEAFLDIFAKAFRRAYEEQAAKDG
jgi:type VI secretion system protein